MLSSNSPSRPPRQEEIDTVLERLRDEKPLRNQQVMIPLSSKAFFAGRLSPTTSSTGTKNVINSQENTELDLAKRGVVQTEQILVNLRQGLLVEMTRQEAIAALEKRLEGGQQTSNRAKSLVASKASAKKKPHARKEEKKALPGENSQQESEEEQRRQVSPITSSDLPFMEIREEYSQTGRIIRSEVVNVAQELKELKKETGGSSDNDDDRTKPLREALEEVSFSPEAINHDEEQGASNDYQVPGPKPPKMRDYSARLEELARLEEESEARKQINSKSSKKLQSNAWGKGFLLQKKKKQPQDRSTSSNSEGLSDRTSIEKPARSTDSSDVIGKTGRDKVEQHEGGAEANKVVSFGGNNEVREIPRVGRQLPVPASSNVNRRTLETSVFSGAVVERPLSVMPSITPAPKAKPEERQQPKRKVSRFAQQRIQQQR